MPSLLTSGGSLTVGESKKADNSGSFLFLFYSSWIPPLTDSSSMVDDNISLPFSFFFPPSFFLGFLLLFSFSVDIKKEANKIQGGIEYLLPFLGSLARWSGGPPNVGRAAFSFLFLFDVFVFALARLHSLVHQHTDSRRHDYTHQSNRTPPPPPVSFFFVLFIYILSRLTHPPRPNPSQSIPNWFLWFLFLLPSLPLSIHTNNPYEYVDKERGV